MRLTLAACQRPDVPEPSTRPLSWRHSSAGRTKASRHKVVDRIHCGRRLRARRPAFSMPVAAMEHSKKSSVPFCPSAPPDSDGAVVFAIIQGTATQPQAAYLDRLVPLTPEIAASAAPVDPAEVFRMSAPCAAHGCRHFAEGCCNLVARLVQLVPSVVTSAPPCMLRPSCMWWQQEGVEACLRCPQVVTHMYGASAPMMEAAAPPERTV